MTAVYLIGMWFCFGVGVVGTVLSLIADSFDSADDFALAIVLTFVLPPLWPVIVTGVVLWAFVRVFVTGR